MITALIIFVHKARSIGMVLQKFISCRRRLRLSLAFLMVMSGIYSAAYGDASDECGEDSPHFYELTDVVYAKDNFYVLEFRGWLFRTVDGESWTLSKVADKETAFNTIAWNGEYFVTATWYGNVFRSRNAEKWEQVWTIDKGRAIHHIRAYEGTFYLVTLSQGYGSLYRSDDNGLSWRKMSAFLDEHGGWDVTDLIYMDGNYFYTLGRNRRLWDLPKIPLPNWHMIVSTARDPKHERELRRISGWIAWGDGHFVVADEGGGRVLTSSDGKTWTEYDIGYGDIHRFYFHDIEWTGKEFLLAGKNGTLLRSKSGKVWSKTETGTDGNLYGIASNGKLHIAVGAPPKDCSQSTSVLISTDGNNWKNVGDTLGKAIRNSKRDSSK